MNTAGHPKQVETYERFFGLVEPPFSLTPNPRFVFESGSHAAALAQVAYALERREPLVVITGEIGAGKTLLCRTLVHRIQRKTFLSVINDPQLDRDDLLKLLLRDFGVISKDPSKRTEASRHDLFRALQDFLASLVPLQAHAVVIIDEAQHMQPEVLEQIRLLSNIDDRRGTLLQIILVGQTDLEPLLSRPELRQFQQRVSRRFRLEPLSADEVQQYIAHRIAVARGDERSQAPGVSELEREVAGWAKATATVTFTPDAIRAIARLSGGLPRVINLVCDRALEAAYAQHTHKIDLPVISTAARALGLTEVPAPTAALPQPAAAAPTKPTEMPAPPQPTATAPTKPAEPGKPVAPVVSVERTVPRKPVQGAEKAVPVAFGPPAPVERAAATRKWLIVGVLLVLLSVVAIWLGSRDVNQRAPQLVSAPVTTVPPSTPSVPASPTVAEPSAPADPAPAPVTGTSATTAAPSPAPPADAAAPTPERFEIVVASFRTDSRATAVAAQVSALGLPVRRRVSDGWQQVLAGPFPSRVEAARAQQRLDNAGVTGTQIVSAGR